MIDPMGVALTFTRSSLELDDPPQNLVFSAPLFRLAARNLPFAPSHHTENPPRHKPRNASKPPNIAFLNTKLHKGHEMEAIRPKSVVSTMTFEKSVGLAAPVRVAMFRLSWINATSFSSPMRWRQRVIDERSNVSLC
jgi:hypothetical protein